MSGNHSSKSGDDDDDSSSNTSSSSGSSTPTPASTATATTPTAPTTPTKSAMTFFVSSTPAGTGGTTNGNLGGLTGADTLCQTLATAVNGGDHTWHAYLSISGATATNAKDRIGPGPWQNQKGTVIATSVAALHDPNFSLGANALDEKGTAVPDTGRYILTGSNADGTPSGNDCTGWTSNTKQQGATLGDGAYDPTTNPYVGAEWNFAKGVFDKDRVTCDTAGMTVLKNSEGRIYCFATN